LTLSQLRDASHDFPADFPTCPLDGRRAGFVAIVAGRQRAPAVNVGMDATETQPTPSPSVTLSHGPLLRPEDAAELLSVKTSWVYEAVRAGRLPCLRVGRHIRFTRPMLEDWLSERAEQPVPVGVSGR
jgi:excisionase family DNA binding protein